MTICSGKGKDLCFTYESGVNVKVLIHDIKEEENTLIERIDDLINYWKEDFELTVSSRLEISYLQLLQAQGKIKDLTIECKTGEVWKCNTLSGFGPEGFWPDKTIDFCRQIVNLRLHPKEFKNNCK